MAKTFEVGKNYYPYQREYGAVKVERRTDKTIWVTNSNGVTFGMRVKTDENGNEYTIDSTVPKKWRDAFTYEAR